jgi:hypothetical protein
MVPDAPCDDTTVRITNFDESLDAEDLDTITNEGFLSMDSTPPTMADLPKLRKALASEAYAETVVKCLRSMALLAVSLSKIDLAKLQGDPLMQEIVQVMETRMHQFTAYRLASCLWSFAHLNFVPTRCEPA